MDETSLRALLEHATSPEPPVGHLVDKSLRAGRRLRRRRRAIGAAALSAVAVVLVSAVPVLTADADHQTNRSRPAAARHEASQSRPAVAQRRPEADTAYVATGSTVVPISLAANTLGTPIPVPGGINDPPFIPSVATSPNGRTIYEVGAPGGVGATVTPIDTATNTAGRTVTIKGAEPQDFVLAPNGQTAYLSAPDGLFRIRIATSTASKVTGCSRFGCRAMAFAPNGQTLYVINGGAKTVIVIRTASDTVLRRIKIPPSSPGIPFHIAITPNGKTAYVVDSTAGAKPGENSVVPINLTTNTALTPIKIPAPGFAYSLIIAPDGRTVYVQSTHAVTAINTATNQAEATMNLPDTPANAYYMVLAPNGKTLYVLTPRGVVPIMTASGTVLPTISVPHLLTFTDMAITPDSRTIYVGAAFFRYGNVHGVRMPVKMVTAGVVPINTTTDTAGRYINLGGDPSSIAFAP